MDCLLSAFGLSERDHGGGKALEPTSVDLDHVNVAAKVIGAQRAREPSAAIGWEDVIWPSGIVPKARWGVEATEDRARSRHQLDQRRVVRDQQLEVLRRHDVRHRHGRLRGVDKARHSGAGHGGLEIGSSGCDCNQLSKGPLDGLDDLGDPGDQPRHAVGSMLGLHHQIDGRQVGRRRGVGDDHDLRRSSERRGNADDPGELALRLGHKDVARTDNHIDSLDGLGAQRHCRDRLRSADRVDLGHAGHIGGGQGGVIDVPVSSWWHAEHDLLHTCHMSGRSTHQHRRGVPSAATRCVAARPLHRGVSMVNRDPIGVKGGRRRRLIGVIGDDPGPGSLKRVTQIRRHAGGRSR